MQEMPTASSLRCKILSLRVNWEKMRARCPASSEPGSTSRSRSSWPLEAAWLGRTSDGWPQIWRSSVMAASISIRLLLLNMPSTCGRRRSRLA